MTSSPSTSAAKESAAFVLRETTPDAERFLERQRVIKAFGSFSAVGRKWLWLSAGGVVAHVPVPRRDERTPTGPHHGSAPTVAMSTLRRREGAEVDGRALEGSRVSPVAVRMGTRKSSRPVPDALQQRQRVMLAPIDQTNLHHARTPPWRVTTPCARVSADATRSSSRAWNTAVLATRLRPRRSPVGVDEFGCSAREVGTVDPHVAPDGEVVGQGLAHHSG